jgi:hypothetical protein
MDTQRTKKIQKNRPLQEVDRRTMIKEITKMLKTTIIMRTISQLGRGRILTIPVVEMMVEAEVVVVRCSLFHFDTSERSYLLSYRLDFD